MKAATRLAMKRSFGFNQLVLMMIAASGMVIFQSIVTGDSGYLGSRTIFYLLFQFLPMTGVALMVSYVMVMKGKLEYLVSCLVATVSLVVGVLGIS